MGMIFAEAIKRIKEERERMGISQIQMARYMCISQTQMDRVEHGARRINYLELKALIKHGVNIHYVITGKRSVKVNGSLFEGLSYTQLLNIFNIVYSFWAEYEWKKDNDNWKVIYTVLDYLKLRNHITDSKINCFILIRTLKNYTQQEMANELSIDIKKLRELENGNCLPDMELIWKLYDVLDCIPAIILEDDKCLLEEIYIMLEEIPEALRQEVLNAIYSLYK